MNTITVKNHRNGRVTVSGFSHADLRLLARAVEEGSFSGGDRGGEVSKSLRRLADALAVPASYPTLHAPVKITGGSSVAADNYHEDADRPDLFEGT